MTELAAFLPWTRISMENEAMDRTHPAQARQRSRREFLKAAAVAGTVMAVDLTSPANVHAGGGDRIRVGLVGCGGRGTGAAENCLTAAPNASLVAMGDAFADQLHDSRRRLLEAGAKDQIRQLGNTVDVPEDRCFVGLDAYKKVLHADIDYVILATPPGFRPIHLAAAVAAGKHVFTEKPVAVDGPGIRRVLAAYDEAMKKSLGIAAGTQRRHQTGYLKTIGQIHDGAIGTVTSGRCSWNQGGLWVKPRQPHWSDLESQIRNWLYFTWLSGDHIVEQHVHNIDVVNWALRAHPIRAVAMGGRQVRTSPEFGHIFDHFAVEFDYENGCKLSSLCRQIDGCENSVAESLEGTKGRSQVNTYMVNGKRVVARGEDNEPYLQEHADLIQSIRAGKPINELKTVAESTLTAIMGRMSAYTGKAVTWERALQSGEEFMPQDLSFDMSLPVPPVAVPGKTPLL